MLRNVCIISQCKTLPVSSKQGNSRSYFKFKCTFAQTHPFHINTLCSDAYIPTNQFMFTIFLTSVDLQLKPYRSDDYIPQLCYESSRFNALGQQWVVKANVVGNEKSLKRVLTYQLVQKGKVNLNVKFLMLRSPFSDLVIKPEVHQQEFSCDSQESSYHDLVLLDPTECNKMLEANTIKLRMIIFQIPSSD